MQVKKNDLPRLDRLLMFAPNLCEKMVKKDDLPRLDRLVMFAATLSEMLRKLQTALLAECLPSALLSLDHPLAAFVSENGTFSCTGFENARIEIPSFH